MRQSAALTLASCVEIEMIKSVFCQFDRYWICSRREENECGSNQGTVFAAGTVQ